MLSGYATPQERVRAPWLGSFLRSFTPGNVWLAEAMTGHLGHEKHDPARAGQRLALRKTITGVGSVPEPGQVGSRSMRRGRTVAWQIKDMD